MVTYTHVQGEIEITPPIPWKAMKEKGYESGFPGGKWKSAKLRIQTEEMDTEEGTLTRRRGTLIIPSEENRYKAYTLVGDVQSIINTFPGHEFSGRLDCEGEDGDMYRVYVKGRAAIKVYPEIVWPDEGDIFD